MAQPDGERPIPRSDAIGVAKNIIDNQAGLGDWRTIIKNQVAKNQLERISLNKTIYESAIGPNLVEAANNLLTDQAGFFDGVARFEILSARRISTSFRVQISGHEGELWEVWEFEMFTHSDNL